MNALQEIGILIAGTLGSLYLTVIVLRFLLQLAKADFYNPVCQFIVKATNPVLIPLRRAIPGFYGVDISSIILAIVFHWLVIQILAMILGRLFYLPGNTLVWAIIGILMLVLNIYLIGMFVMIIASWVAPGSRNPVLMLIRQLVEPIIAPFHRLITPMGGIDITPIFALLAIHVCRILVRELAVMSQLQPAIVLGF